MNTWLNEEADKFGNTMSHQLSSKKEMREKEGKIYIGNSKRFESTEPAPLSINDINSFSEVEDSLSF